MISLKCSLFWLPCYIYVQSLLAETFFFFWETKGPEPKGSEN